MRSVGMKRRPKPIKWVVSPELRKRKNVDSAWVAAMTREGAIKTAISALKIFGVMESYIVNLWIRKLEDVMR